MHVNELSRSNEVEIKFAVNDLAALRQKLAAAGFRERTPRTPEMNVLYDLDGRPLRSRGELLRIRKYGEAWKLTHKGRGSAGKHKSRVETETGIADGAALERIFAALGLSESFRYEKFRSEWSDGSGEVVLDETPIGDFAEIEGAPEWIDAVAAKLGVAEGDYITDSYAQLFQQWKQRTGSAAEQMTFAAIPAPG
jgi:adenylate cyclase, class 2